MREILFKAKSIHDDEWVQGGLVHQTDFYGDKVDRYFIIDGTATQDYDIGFEIEVKPETVGQYIGLTDKNGRKIFEGDILKLRTGRICKVVYESNNSFCGFTLVHISGLEYPSVSFGFYRNCEVIGNIYDNVILPSMESLKPEYCEKCGQRLDWRKEYE